MLCFSGAAYCITNQHGTDKQSSAAGGKDHSLTFVLKEDETDKNGRVPLFFCPPANGLAPTPSSLS